MDATYIQNNLDEYELGNDKVNLAAVCFTIAQEKGFYEGIELLQDPNHVKGQLLHLFIEFGEFMDSDSGEELADAVIVLADICGYVGIDLFPSRLDIWEDISVNAVIAIAAQLANTYRKTLILDPMLAEGVFAGLFSLAGDDIDLRQEIVDKCGKNMKRERRYGTPQAAK